MLDSLPADFKFVKQMIYADEGVLSVEELIRKVLHFETSRVKEHQSTNTAATSETALYAQGAQSAPRGKSYGTYRGGGGFGTSGRGQNRSAPHPPRSESVAASFKCYRCGGQGHRAATCSTPAGLGGSSGSPSALDAPGVVTCFACGEAGHRSKGCPHDTLTCAQAERGRSALLRWSTSRSAPGADTNATAYVVEGSSDIVPVDTNLPPMDDGPGGAF